MIPLFLLLLPPYSFPLQILWCSLKVTWLYFCPSHPIKVAVIKLPLEYSCCQIQWKVLRLHFTWLINSLRYPHSFSCNTSSSSFRAPDILGFPYTTVPLHHCFPVYSSDSSSSSKWSVAQDLVFEPLLFSVWIHSFDFCLQSHAQMTHILYFQWSSLS